MKVVVKLDKLTVLQALNKAIRTDWPDDKGAYPELEQVVNMFATGQVISLLVDSDLCKLSILK